MDGQGLVGLEAWAPDGTSLGRVTEVLTGEDADGVVVVTHVVVESDGEYQELPFSSVDLDPEADFGIFRPDEFDDEPGEHEDEEVRPAGYAPNKPFFGPGDSPHDGQFVTTPTDEHEAADLDEVTSTEAGEASVWEDEGSTTVDGGYPRNDVYIDPDTGDEVQEPLLKENDGLADDIADLVSGTSVEVTGEVDGVVQLSGSVASREDLESILSEIMAQTGVLGVDAGDVDVG